MISGIKNRKKPFIILSTLHKDFLTLHAIALRNQMMDEYLQRPSNDQSVDAQMCNGTLDSKVRNFRSLYMHETLSRTRCALTKITIQNSQGIMTSRYSGLRKGPISTLLSK